MFGGIGLVYAKTFKSRLLVFLLCLVFVFSIPLNVSAANGLANAPTFDIGTSVNLQFTEGTRVGTTNTYMDSGVFTGSISRIIYPSNGSFFGGGKYNVNYNYIYSRTNFLSWQGGSYSGQYLIEEPEVHFTLLLNDYEIPLADEGQGWLQFPSTVGSADYLILRCDYSYQYLVKYSSGTLGGDVTIALNPSIGFSFTQWTEYDLVDYYAHLMNEVQNISSDLGGVNQSVQNQTQVITDKANQQIQNQETQIQQSQQQIVNQQTQIQEQQETNRLQEESNQQNKNFMDNFFGNLGNTVLGWIVPSSEQITMFFDEVNAWFSDRLGFVWYPFDLAYQLVSAFALGDANTMFKVPAFTLNFQGQQLTIWNPIEVDIDAFGIFSYVRFFTSALIVCGVIKMAIDKWDEWIGGHAK